MVHMMGGKYYTRMLTRAKGFFFRNGIFLFRLFFPKDIFSPSDLGGFFLLFYILLGFFFLFPSLSFLLVQEDGRLSLGFCLSYIVFYMVKMRDASQLRFTGALLFFFMLVGIERGGWVGYGVGYSADVGLRWERWLRDWGNGGGGGTGLAKLICFPRYVSYYS